MNIQEAQTKALESKWKYSCTRRMSYQKVRLYHLGLAKFGQVFGFDMSHELYRIKNFDNYQYYLKSEIDSMRGSLKNKLGSGIDSSNEVLKIFESIGPAFDSYLAFCKALKSIYSTDSNGLLNDALNAYYRANERLHELYWVLFNDVEEVLVESTVAQMKEEFGIGEATKMISDITEPIEMIPLDLEKLSLYKVALLSGDEQKLALQKHVEEFSYMPMYDIDFEIYSQSHFEDKLKELLSTNTTEQIKKRIVDIERMYAGRVKGAADVLKKLKGSKSYALAKCVTIFASKKDRKPYIRDKGNYFIRPLFVEVAKRLGITLRQTLFLTKEELSDLLLSNKKADADELDMRTESCAFYCNDKEMIVLTDRSFLSKLDEALKEKKISELKGLAVSPGKATGKVTIVLSNADFAKFSDGNILVSSATRPDFVPLMKMAAAIVTDEGGLLSHAAIVSRELKKPCVVGTKIATQTLKDGDVIEVDAITGVIKIV